jgi:hypothetical protein
MKAEINCGGVIVALFLGFLAAALFHLSFAWCVVIGIGSVPALVAIASVLIWIVDRPSTYRLERYFVRRKRAKLKKRNEKRVAAIRAQRDREYAEKQAARDARG